MSKFIDLTGQRFGRLVVTASWEKRTTPNGITKPYWLCKCDCGNEKWVSAYSLRSGNSTSCGCYHKEKFGDINRKHT